jgi:hypothetical protein
MLLRTSIIILIEGFTLTTFPNFSPVLHLLLLLYYCIPHNQGTCVTYKDKCHLLFK